MDVADRVTSLESWLTGEPDKRRREVRVGGVHNSHPT